MIVVRELSVVFRTTKYLLHRNVSFHFKVRTDWKMSWTTQALSKCSHQVNDGVYLVIILPEVVTAAAVLRQADSKVGQKNNSQQITGQISETKKSNLLVVVMVTNGTIGICNKSHSRIWSQKPK